MPNGLNILIAEDDPCIAMMLSDVLSDLGHRVVKIVDTAEEAIRLAGEQPFDLAVVDVWLANGSNGLIAVRQRMGRYDSPASVCSGHAAAEEARAAGALAFLEKPFRITDLERALDHAVPTAGTPAVAPGTKAHVAAT